MTISLDIRAAEPAPERRQGDFSRHPGTGAPYVAHPTETTKRTGKKDELLAEAQAAGIDVPAKATVATLHELLGPRPKRVQYGRPSSLGKQIENMTNIQKWSERATALGVFLDPDLFAELAELDADKLTLDDPDARTLLDRIAVAAKNRAQAHLAAERGTHTHALTEDVDDERDWLTRAEAGEHLGLPTGVQRGLVDAWQAMLATHGVEILAAEASVVDDVWRQAGTLDRICRLGADVTFRTPHGELVVLPAGWVGILDIKTGRLRLDQAGNLAYWQGYAVQLASYAQAVPYDVDTDRRGEWPWPIDQRWAIIAHLDVLAALDGTARCRLFLVDLEAGREAGERCVWARGWEKRTDVFSVVDDALMVEVMIAAHDDPAARGVEQPAESGAGTTDDPTPSAAPDSATTDATDPAAFAMLAEAIINWPLEVRKRLFEVWPAGIPTPGAVRRGEAMWTDDHLDGITAACNVAEAPFNVVTNPPAPVPEPRRALAPAPAPVDDGGRADEALVEGFLASITGDTVRLAMNAWMVEAKAAGASWHPRIVGTVRSLEIARAAHRLAVIFAGDDDCDTYVRAVLARVMDTDAAEFPTTAVGVALAALTIDEARTVQRACEALATDGLTLQFSDDGHPLIVGDLAASAA